MRRLYIKPTVKTIHLESIELLAGSPVQVDTTSAAPEGSKFGNTLNWDGDGTGDNF